MVMELKNEQFGDMQLAQLTQRHVEEFFRVMRENKVEPDGISSAEYAGGMLRAAISAGWFPGLVASEVDHMNPGKVVWLKNWIQQYLMGLYVISPNSFGLPLNVQETQDGSLQKS